MKRYISPSLCGFIHSPVFYSAHLFFHPLLPSPRVWHFTQLPANFRFAALDNFTYDVKIAERETLPVQSRNTDRGCTILRASSSRRPQGRGRRLHKNRSFRLEGWRKIKTRTCLTSDLHCHCIQQDM